MYISVNTEYNTRHFHGKGVISMPYRTPDDQLDRARQLRRKARSIRDSANRRRLQNAAARIEQKAIKRLEAQTKPARKRAKQNTILL